MQHALDSEGKQATADKGVVTIQGVGNFVNVAVIIILIVCFNQIKPGNGPGRAGFGYNAPYIKAGKKMVYNYKYRPNALSGMQILAVDLDHALVEICMHSCWITLVL